MYFEVCTYAPQVRGKTQTNKLMHAGLGGQRNLRCRYTLCTGDVHFTKGWGTTDRQISAGIN